MRNDSIRCIAQRIISDDPNNWRESLQKEIIGTTVLTDYTNKTYRIDDVDFTMSPRSTFKDMKGNEKTFAQYYQEKYNITIKDLNQFLLVSKCCSKYFF
jgi:aubergine-like protein